MSPRDYIQAAIHRADVTSVRVGPVTPRAHDVTCLSPHASFHHLVELLLCSRVQLLIFLLRPTNLSVWRLTGHADSCSSELLLTFSTVKHALIQSLQGGCKMIMFRLLHALHSHLCPPPPPFVIYSLLV